MQTSMHASSNKTCQKLSSVIRYDWKASDHTKVRRIGRGKHSEGPCELHEDTVKVLEATLVCSLVHLSFFLPRR